MTKVKKKRRQKADHVEGVAASKHSESADKSKSAWDGAETSLRKRSFQSPSKTVATKDGPSIQPHSVGKPVSTASPAPASCSTDLYTHRSDEAAPSGQPKQDRPRPCMIPTEDSQSEAVNKLSVSDDAWLKQRLRKHGSLTRMLTPQATKLFRSGIALLTVYRVLGYRAAFVRWGENRNGVRVILKLRADGRLSITAPGQPKLSKNAMIAQLISQGYEIIGDS